MVVEAMACGAPVVAADAAALPEACDGAALLVPPLDVIAWRDAMVHVDRDRDAREDLRTVRSSAPRASTAVRPLGLRSSCCDDLPKPRDKPVRREPLRVRPQRRGVETSGVEIAQRARERLAPKVRRRTNRSCPRRSFPTRRRRDTRSSGGPAAAASSGTRPKSSSPGKIAARAFPISVVEFARRRRSRASSCVVPRASSRSAPSAGPVPATSSGTPAMRRGAGSRDRRACTAESRDATTK